jgi:hypothetical protein
MNTPCTNFGCGPSIGGGEKSKGKFSPFHKHCVQLFLENPIIHCELCISNAIVLFVFLCNGVINFDALFNILLFRLIFYNFCKCNCWSISILNFDKKLLEKKLRFGAKQVLYQNWINRYVRIDQVVITSWENHNRPIFTKKVRTAQHWSKHGNLNVCILKT